MALFEPPTGYNDLMSDADHTTRAPAPFRELEVPGIGTVMARKPTPAACGALAMSARAKVSSESRRDYLNLFLVNHLADGEYDRLLEGMGCDTLPADAVARVGRAIATWGTGRPTLPSSI